MGRQKITISITDADFILWSKHYEACDSNMSKWISDVIHLALEKKLDAPMLRRDPDRVSVTARGLGASLVQNAPPPKPEYPLLDHSVQYFNGIGPVPEGATKVRSSDNRVWYQHPDHPTVLWPIDS